MDEFKKEFLSLIKSSFTGERYTPSDGFDLRNAAILARKHGIVPLVYYGLVNSGFPFDRGILQEMFLFTCQNISVSERQQYELTQLFAAFDQAEIDYLPLKGTILKHLYPKKEMRMMGDADILIRKEQYGE